MGVLLHEYKNMEIACCNTNSIFQLLFHESHKQLQHRLSNGPEVVIVEALDARRHAVLKKRKGLIQIVKTIESTSIRYRSTLSRRIDIESTSIRWSLRSNSDCLPHNSACIIHPKNYGLLASPLDHNYSSGLQTHCYPVDHRGLNSI